MSNMFDTRFLFFFFLFVIQAYNYEISLIIPSYVDTVRVDQYIQLIKDDLLETAGAPFTISYTVNDTAEGVNEFITKHNKKDVVFFGFSFTMDYEYVDRFLSENNLLMLSPDPAIRNGVCSKNIFFPSSNIFSSLEYYILKEDFRIGGISTIGYFSKPLYYDEFISEWAFETNYTYHYHIYHDCFEDAENVLKKDLENITAVAPEGSLILVDFPTFPLVQILFQKFEELNLSTDKYRIVLLHFTLSQLLDRIPNLNNHYYITKYSIHDKSAENMKFYDHAHEYFKGDTLIGDYVFYVYWYIDILVDLIVSYRTTNSQLLTHSITSKEYDTAVGKMRFHSDYSITTSLYLNRIIDKTDFVTLLKVGHKYLPLSPYLYVVTEYSCDIYPVFKKVFNIGLLYSLHGIYAEEDYLYLRGNLKAITDFNARNEGYTIKYFVYDIESDEKILVKAMRSIASFVKLVFVGLGERGRSIAESVIDYDSSYKIASVYPSEPNNANCMIFKLGYSPFDYPHYYIPTANQNLLIYINTVFSQRMFNYFNESLSDMKVLSFHIPVEKPEELSPESFNSLLNELQNIPKKTPIYYLCDSLFNLPFIKWIEKNPIQYDYPIIFHTMTTFDRAYIQKHKVDHIYRIRLKLFDPFTEVNITISTTHEYALGYFSMILMAQLLQINSPIYESNMVLNTPFSSYSLSQSHYASVGLDIILIRTKDEMECIEVGGAYHSPSPFLYKTPMFCHSNYIIHLIPVIYILRPLRLCERRRYELLNAVIEYFEQNILFDTAYHLNLHYYYNSEEKSLDEILPYVCNKYNPKLIIVNDLNDANNLEEIEKVLYEHSAYIVTLGDYDSHKPPTCIPHIIHYGSSMLQKVHPLVDYNIMKTNNFAIFGLEDSEIFNIIYEDMKYHQLLYPFLSLNRYNFKDDDEVLSLVPSIFGSLENDTIIISTFPHQSLNIFIDLYQNSSLSNLYVYNMDCCEYYNFHSTKPYYVVRNVIPIPNDIILSQNDLLPTVYKYLNNPEFFYTCNDTMTNMLVAIYVFTSTALSHGIINDYTLSRTVLNITNENSVGKFGYILSNTYLKKGSISKIYEYGDTEIVYECSHLLTPYYPYVMESLPLYHCNVRNYQYYNVSESTLLLYLDDFSNEISRTNGVLTIQQLYSNFVPDNINGFLSVSKSTPLVYDTKGDMNVLFDILKKVSKEKPINVIISLNQDVINEYEDKLKEYSNVYYWNLKYPVPLYCNERIIFAGLSFRQRLEIPIMNFIFKGYKQFLIFYDDNSVYIKKEAEKLLSIFNTDYDSIFFCKGCTVTQLFLVYPLIRLNTVILNLIETELFYTSVDLYTRLLKLYGLDQTTFTVSEMLPMVISSSSMIPVNSSIPFYKVYINPINSMSIDLYKYFGAYYVYNYIMFYASHLAILSVTNGCIYTKNIESYVECIQGIDTPVYSQMKYSVSSTLHLSYNIYLYLFNSDKSIVQIRTENSFRNTIFSYEHLEEETCSFNQIHTRIYKIGIIYGEECYDSITSNTVFIYTMLLTLDYGNTITKDLIFIPYIFHIDTNKNNYYSQLNQVIEKNLVYIFESGLDLENLIFEEWIKVNDILLFHDYTQVSAQCKKKVIYMGSTYHYLLQDVVPYIAIHLNSVMYMIQENGVKYKDINEMVQLYYTQNGGNIVGNLVFNQYTIINVEKISMLLAAYGIIGIVGSQNTVEKILDKLDAYMNTFDTNDYHIIIFTPIDKRILKKYHMSTYSIDFLIPDDVMNILSSLYPIDFDFEASDSKTCFVSYNCIMLLLSLVNTLEEKNIEWNNTREALRLIESQELDPESSQNKLYFTYDSMTLQNNHYMLYKTRMYRYDADSKEIKAYYTFLFHPQRNPFGVYSDSICNYDVNGNVVGDSYFHVAFFHTLSGEYANVGIKLLIGELNYLREVHYTLGKKYRVIPIVVDTNSNMDYFDTILERYNITHIVGCERLNVRQYLSQEKYMTKRIWHSHVIIGGECKENFYYTGGDFSLYKSIQTITNSKLNEKHIFISQMDGNNLNTLIRITGLDQVDYMIITIPLDRECEPFLLPHTSNYVYGTVFHLIISGPTLLSTINYLHKLDLYESFTLIVYNYNPNVPNLSNLWDKIYFIGTLYRQGSEETVRMLNGLDKYFGLSLDSIYTEYPSGYNCMNFMDKAIELADSVDRNEINKKIYSIMIHAPDGILTIRKNNYGTRFFRIYQYEDGSLRTILDDPIPNEPKPWYLYGENGIEYQCDHQHNLGEKIAIEKRQYVLAIIDPSLDTAPSEIQLVNTIRGLFETRFDSYYGIFDTIDVIVITVDDCLLPDMNIILNEDILFIISHIKAFCTIEYIPYLEQADKIMIISYSYQNLICNKHIISTSQNIRVTSKYFVWYLFQENAMDMFFTVIYDNEEDDRAIQYYIDTFKEFHFRYSVYKVDEDHTFNNAVENIIKDCKIYLHCKLLYVLPFAKLTSFINALSNNTATEASYNNTILLSSSLSKASNKETVKYEIFCPTIEYKLLKDLTSYFTLPSDIMLFTVRSRTDEESCELQSEMYVSTTNCEDNLVYDSTLELFYMTNVWLNASINTNQYKNSSLLLDYFYNHNIITSIHTLSYTSYIYGINSTTSYVVLKVTDYFSHFYVKGVLYKCSMSSSDDGVAEVVDKSNIIDIGYFYSLFCPSSVYYNTYLIAFYTAVEYFNEYDNIDNYFINVHYFDLSQDDKTLKNELIETKIEVFFGGTFPEEKHRISSLLFEYDKDAVLFYTGWSSRLDCICNTITFNALPEQYVNIIFTHWGMRLYHTVILYNSDREVSSIVPLISKFIIETNHSITLHDTRNSTIFEVYKNVISKSKLPVFILNILDIPYELYLSIVYYNFVKDALHPQSKLYSFFVTETMILDISPKNFDDTYIVSSSDQEFTINNVLYEQLHNVIYESILNYYNVPPLLENTLNALTFWRSTVARKHRFNYDSYISDYYFPNEQFLEGTLNGYTLSNDGYFSRPIYIAHFFANGTVIKQGVEYSIDPQYSPFSMSIPTNSCDCSVADPIVKIPSEKLFILVYPVIPYYDIKTYSSNMYMTLFAACDYFRSIFGSITNYRWVFYISIIDKDRSIGVNEFERIISQKNCVGVIGGSPFFEVNSLNTIIKNYDTYYFPIFQTRCDQCDKYYISIAPTPNQLMNTVEYLVNRTNEHHVILLIYRNDTVMKYAFEKQFKDNKEVKTYVEYYDDNFSFSDMYKRYSHNNFSYIISVLGGNYAMNELTVEYSKLSSDENSKYRYIFISYFEYDTPPEFNNIFTNHFIIKSYYHSIYSKTSVIFQNYLLYVSSNNEVITESMEYSYSVLTLLQTVFNSKRSFNCWDDIEPELYRLLYNEYNVTTLSSTLTSPYGINYFTRELQVLQLSTDTINYGLKLYYNSIFKTAPIPYYGFPNENKLDCYVGPTRVMNKSNSSIEIINPVLLLFETFFSVLSLLSIYYIPVFERLAKEGKVYIVLLYIIVTLNCFSFFTRPYHDLVDSSDCYEVKIYWIYMLEFFCSFEIAKLLHLFLYRNCTILTTSIPSKIIVPLILIFPLAEIILWAFDSSSIDSIHMQVSEKWSEDLRFITVQIHCDGGDVFYVLRLVILISILLFSLLIFWRARYYVLPNKSLIYVHLINCLTLLIYLIFNGFIVMYLYKEQFEVINQILAIDEPVFLFVYILVNTLLRYYLSKHDDLVDENNKKTKLDGSTSLMSTIQNKSIQSLKMSQISVVSKGEENDSSSS